MRQSSLHGYFAATKRPALCDEIDMEAPDSLRNYLDSESIEHDSSMPLEHLKMLVKRRVKRRARERGEKPPKPQPDALDCMRTLRGVKRAMVRLAEDLRSSTDDQIFSKACFVIDMLQTSTSSRSSIMRTGANAAEMSRAADAGSAVPLRPACSTTHSKS